MEDNKRLISDMDMLERPREKAMHYGFDSLTDAEVMAIIFATGVQGKSVVELCHEILDANNNHLSWIARKPYTQLCQEHKGIGRVKAITLMAALELGRRLQDDVSSLVARDAVRSSAQAFEIMRNRFVNLQHEEFWVMYIDQAGHVVGERRISQGGTNCTSVDIKIILREGLQCLAQSMILFHNHPSGTLRPSAEDDKLTRRIVDAAKMVDIRVNDHIIVACDRYYAYSDHGKI